MFEGRRIFYPQVVLFYIGEEMGFYRGVEQNKSEEKKLREIPEKGFGLFFHILFTHATKILLLNLLFAAFSIPIVTLPAALSGVSRVLMLLMKDGYVHVFQDFWKEFKESFWRSLALGAIFAVIFALLYIAAKLYPVILADEIFSTVCFSLSVALIVILGVVFSYAIPMQSMVQLPFSKLIKNSCILLYARPLATLFLAAIVVLENYLIFGLFPETIPLTLVIIPAAAQLGICTVLKPVFEDLIYDE